MNKTHENLRGWYQAPECEIVNLICSGAVLVTSGETGATVDDWVDDGLGILPF